MKEDQVKLRVTIRSKGPAEWGPFSRDGAERVAAALAGRQDVDLIEVLDEKGGA